MTLARDWFSEVSYRRGYGQLPTACDTITNCTGGCPLRGSLRREAVRGKLQTTNATAFISNRIKRMPVKILNLVPDLQLRLYLRLKTENSNRKRRFSVFLCAYFRKRSCRKSTTNTSLHANIHNQLLFLGQYDQSRK